MGPYSFASVRGSTFKLSRHFFSQRKVQIAVILVIVTILLAGAYLLQGQVLLDEQRQVREGSTTIISKSLRAGWVVQIHVVVTFGPPISSVIRSDVSSDQLFLANNFVDRSFRILVPNDGNYFLELWNYSSQGNATVRVTMVRELLSF